MPVYHYRKRRDGTSQLDRSWADPGRFTDVLEHGYLALLEAGCRAVTDGRRHGCRAWSYQLSWYLRWASGDGADGRELGGTVGSTSWARICAMLDRPGIGPTAVSPYAAVGADNRSFILRYHDKLVQTMPCNQLGARPYRSAP